MEKKLKENGNVQKEHISKKGRHRKKQLYNSILQQMEFYFSDSNLTKDRFLAQLLEKNPYVELDVFLKFNKIRKLTSNIEDIQKAITKSQLIELSEDKKSICRKDPVKVKTNVDECTIYVERLKSDVTHEWLSSVFSEFGNVVYVSIPKYKNSGVIKGFAFIEFDKESEAEKALDYFESIGCKMPSDKEPEQLCSIATFEGDGDKGSESQPILESSSKKRRFEEVDENNECEENKRQKIESGDASESDDAENKKKKKLKKEHKKKNFIKELGLQVLSKKEWKKMRNRYLDLQKKKMKEFKKHLHKAKYNQANYEDKPKKTNEASQEKKNSEISENEIEEGLIVKINLSEPITDTKKLKNDLKSLSADIKYVDVPNVGSDHIYVRFSNNESAKNFCNHEFGGKKEVLAGENEKAYWNQIKEKREQKVKKGNKKQRGRDKLLKKAKHIKFDE